MGGGFSCCSSREDNEISGGEVIMTPRLYQRILRHKNEQPKIKKLKEYHESGENALRVSTLKDININRFERFEKYFPFYLMNIKVFV
jgi:hypothetical protein